MRLLLVLWALAAGALAYADAAQSAAGSREQRRSGHAVARRATVVRRLLQDAGGASGLGLAASAPACDPACELAQRGALTNLFDAWGGSGWYRKGDWLSSGVHVCRWEGVSCCLLAVGDANGATLQAAPLLGSDPACPDSATGVMSLSLALNNMSGDVGAVAWGTLAATLRILELDDNALYGSTTSLAPLVNLTLLSAGTNQLSGPVDPLTRLREAAAILLHANRLAGPLPGELLQLPKLQVLDLDSNLLTGALPPEAFLAGGGVLRDVHLGNNGLEGPFPELPAGSQLSASLSYVELSSNALNGSLPRYLGLIPLTHLDASGNRLAGPVAPLLRSAWALYFLSLANNSLTGSIPDDLRGRHLQTLDLSSNLLTGSLPPALGRMLDLEQLALEGNAGLGGALPGSLGATGTLVYVDVLGTGLRAALPGAAGMPPYIGLSNSTYPSGPDAGDPLCPQPYLRQVSTSDASHVGIAPYYWHYQGCACAYGYVAEFDVAYANGTNATTTNAAANASDPDDWGPVVGMRCVLLPPEPRPPRGGGSGAMIPWWAILSIVAGGLLLLAAGLLLLHRLVPSVVRYRAMLAKRMPPGFSRRQRGCVVTLVLTDVEGSTELWEWDTDLMAAAIDLHDHTLRSQMSKWYGYEVQTEGDAFLMAFHEPADAVGWCITTQLQLLNAEWDNELFRHHKACVETVDSISSQQGGQAGHREPGRGHSHGPAPVPESGPALGPGPGGPPAPPQTTEAAGVRAAMAAAGLGGFGGGGLALAQGPNSLILQPSLPPGVLLGGPMGQHSSGNTPPRTSGCGVEDVGAAPGAGAGGGGGAAGRAPSGRGGGEGGDGRQLKWSEDVKHHDGTVSLASDLVGFTKYTRQSVLFRGLRVRMGVATGVTDAITSHAITQRMEYSGEVYRRVQAVAELPQGGQVLLDANTFNAIHNHLNDLGIRTVQVLTRDKRTTHAGGGRSGVGSGGGGGGGGGLRRGSFEIRKQPRPRRSLELAVAPEQVPDPAMMVLEAMEGSGVEEGERDAEGGGQLSAAPSARRPILQLWSAMSGLHRYNSSRAPPASPLPRQATGSEASARNSGALPSPTTSPWSAISTALRSPPPASGGGAAPPAPASAPPTAPAPAPTLGSPLPNGSAAVDAGGGGGGGGGTPAAGFVPTAPASSPLGQLQLHVASQLQQAQGQSPQQHPHHHGSGPAAQAPQAQAQAQAPVSALAHSKQHSSSYRQHHAYFSLTGSGTGGGAGGGGTAPNVGLAAAAAAAGILVAPPHLDGGSSGAGPSGAMGSSSAAAGPLLGPRGMSRDSSGRGNDSGPLRPASHPGAGREGAGGGGGPASAGPARAGGGTGAGSASDPDSGFLVSPRDPRIGHLREVPQGSTANAGPTTRAAAALDSAAREQLRRSSLAPAIAVVNMGVFELNAGGSVEYVNITQVLVPGLEERARLCRPPDDVHQLTPGYFNAPATLVAPLGAMRPGSRLRTAFPYVTLVFLAMERYADMLAVNRDLSLDVMASYNDCVRRSLLACNGYECQEQEGNYMIAFAQPAEALEWCLMVQELMMEVAWSAPMLALPSCHEELQPLTGAVLFRGPRIKAGVYQGFPTRVSPHSTTGRADYFGPLVNRAARYCHAAAQGGQVIVARPLVEDILKALLGPAWVAARAVPEEALPLRLAAGVDNARVVPPRWCMPQDAGSMGAGGAGAAGAQGGGRRGSSLVLGQALGFVGRRRSGTEAAGHARTAFTGDGTESQGEAHSNLGSVIVMQERPASPFVEPGGAHPHPPHRGHRGSMEASRFSNTGSEAPSPGYHDHHHNGHRNHHNHRRSNRNSHNRHVPVQSSLLEASEDPVSPRGQPAALVSSPEPALEGGEAAQLQEANGPLGIQSGSDSSVQSSPSRSPAGSGSASGSRSPSRSRTVSDPGTGPSHGGPYGSTNPSTVSPHDAAPGGRRRDGAPASAPLDDEDAPEPSFRGFETVEVSPLELASFGVSLAALPRRMRQATEQALTEARRQGGGGMRAASAAYARRPTAPGMSGAAPHSAAMARAQPGQWRAPSQGTVYVAEALARSAAAVNLAPGGELSALSLGRGPSVTAAAAAAGAGAWGSLGALPGPRSGVGSAGLRPPLATDPAYYPADLAPPAQQELRAAAALAAMRAGRAASGSSRRGFGALPSPGPGGALPSLPSLPSEGAVRGGGGLGPGWEAAQQQQQRGVGPGRMSLEVQGVYRGTAGGSGPPPRISAGQLPLTHGHGQPRSAAGMRSAFATAGVGPGGPPSAGYGGHGAAGGATGPASGQAQPHSHGPNLLHHPGHGQGPPPLHAQLLSPPGPGTHHPSAAAGSAATSGMQPPSRRASSRRMQPHVAAPPHSQPSGQHGGAAAGGGAASGYPSYTAYGGAGGGGGGGHQAVMQSIDVESAMSQEHSAAFAALWDIAYDEGGLVSTMSNAFVERDTGHTSHHVPAASYNGAGGGRRTPYYATGDLPFEEVLELGGEGDVEAVTGPRRGSGGGAPIGRRLPAAQRPERAKQRGSFMMMESAPGCLPTLPEQCIRRRVGAFKWLWAAELVVEDLGLYRFKGVAGNHPIVSVSTAVTAERKLGSRVKKTKGERVEPGRGLLYRVQLQPAERLAAAAAAAAGSGGAGGSAGGAGAAGPGGGGAVVGGDAANAHNLSGAFAQLPPAQSSGVPSPGPAAAAGTGTGAGAVPGAATHSRPPTSPPSATPGAAGSESASLRAPGSPSLGLHQSGVRLDSPTGRTTPTLQLQLPPSLLRTGAVPSGLRLGSSSPASPRAGGAPAAAAAAAAAALMQGPGSDAASGDHPLGGAGDR
ncbi:hypothetical protein HYH03_000611 [Edaphochlamys debaryana]|uniref:Guanylate cyclase domain-containing protein n=1 Tax=Edaphochlamys debaryana TaxID=47281 RepID=A0A836C7K7_9CHLO|nr:hypothetical protein HYH03_000611 [Edaphochlamys debaryana]|eukprot:KAG2502119.1 hypothetical protein HYH03_000611 [Edaphochlamys debaryana]